VRSKNERVELAIRIMRYRELSRRTIDEDFLRPIREKIAELEQKLREIDE
jgi:DNA replication initiation complex subunit (GINS family)